MRNLFNRAFGNLSDNSWYLCVEVFWASIYASGLAFAGAYAIRLGASNSAVSLLSSIPALMAAVTLLAFGHFQQSRARPSRWILTSLLIGRAGTLLYVLVPWLRIGGLPAGTLFVVFFSLLTLPNNFFNLGFVPFLAQALPEPHRADTFAARNVLTGAGVSSCTYLFGLWLVWAPFPANYQGMFFVGFLASMLSLWFLWKVKVSEPPRAAQSKAASDWRSSFMEWLAFFRASWKVRPFTQITFNTFLYGMGMWAAAPLLLLYFVRSLGASDRWLGSLASVTNLSAIFGYLFWQRVIRRWGEGKTLRWTIVAMGLYPLLAGAIPSLTAILFVAAIIGIVTAGVNLTHLNTFLKAIPEGERHNYTALHQTLMNVGAFICPTIGILLANQFGFATVLIGCGLLAILGAVSFWVWPVGQVTQAGLASGLQADSLN
jgi:Na+/melibiose symporter-like transporter